MGNTKFKAHQEAMVVKSVGTINEGEQVGAATNTYWVAPEPRDDIPFYYMTGVQMLMLMYLRLPSLIWTGSSGEFRKSADMRYYCLGVRNAEEENVPLGWSVVGCRSVYVQYASNLASVGTSRGAHHLATVYRYCPEENLWKSSLSRYTSPTYLHSGSLKRMSGRRKILQQP